MEGYLVNAIYLCSAFLSTPHAQVTYISISVDDYDFSSFLVFDVLLQGDSKNSLKNLKPVPSMIFLYIQ